MAQGNWNPDVIKAKPRCRFCRRIVLAKDMVRLDGVNPAHKVCADERQRTYTVGTEIHRRVENLGASAKACALAVQLENTDENAV